VHDSRAQLLGILAVCLPDPVDIVNSYTLGLGLGFNSVAERTWN